MITVKNLSKEYKKTLAVDDLSLDVPDGAVFGLIGLNGAGKTSVIKSISGLLKKFNGTIIMNSHEWGTKEYKASFAFLPELFTPHHYLTGWEYLAFMQELHNKKLDREETLLLCDALGFDRALLNAKTRTYSKGTAQKLGIIQTVSTAAPVMILDEPMSGLDPLARAQFKAVMNGVHDAGHTVFLSTHILHDIDTMCTHLGILHRGRLLFSGTPDELKGENNTESLEEAFLKEIQV